MTFFSCSSDDKETIVLSNLAFYLCEPCLVILRPYWIAWCSGYHPIILTLEEVMRTWLYLLSSLLFTINRY
ncbi:hypothetical protein HD806DRAFT_483510 [Xylariaceae sp. AK1471]|nr:hypothetical protein HD806DRAFT_483510 [Xylariaceae sp. AK1471]